MTVFGYRPGIYGNSYNANNINNISVRDGKNISSKQASDVLADNKNQQTSNDITDQVKIKAPKIVTEGQLEDFVFDFKKNKEFSMEGSESKLDTLDNFGKVSDSKKDDILDQYKYFVNDNNNGVFQSEDGVVMRVKRS